MNQMNQTSQSREIFKDTTPLVRVKANTKKELQMVGLHRGERES